MGVAGLISAPLRNGKRSGEMPRIGPNRAIRRPIGNPNYDNFTKVKLF
jgi:hypothetical protein